MKLLGSNDGSGQPNRSQDDNAVGYVFQRHHPEEFPHFAHKAPRWASGDDAIIDVSVSKFVAFFSSFFALFCSILLLKLLSPNFCIPCRVFWNRCALDQGWAHRNDRK